MSHVHWQRGERETTLTVTTAADATAGSYGLSTESDVKVMSTQGGAIVIELE